MAKINPYLRFNEGKCKEAMEFYKECLGGELTFMTVGESPMASEMPAEAQEKIMHSTLKKKDLEFFASDMMRDKTVIGDNVALSLNCESEDEIKIYLQSFLREEKYSCPWKWLFGEGFLEY